MSTSSTCLWSSVDSSDIFRHMSFDPSRPYNDLPDLPPAVDLESKAVLKACVKARAALAALRQATALIPNPTVLINTIPLLEAQASSEIENIVTTTDALFRHARMESLPADLRVSIIPINSPMTAVRPDWEPRFVRPTTRLSAR